MLVQEGDGLHQGNSSKSGVCIDEFNLSGRIRTDILEEEILLNWGITALFSLTAFHFRTVSHFLMTGRDSF